VVGLLWADFHENHKWRSALYEELQCQISSKLDSKCGIYGYRYKFIHTLNKALRKRRWFSRNLNRFKYFEGSLLCRVLFKLEANKRTHFKTFVWLLRHLFSCNSKLYNDITLRFSPKNFTQISQWIFNVKVKQSFY